MSASSLSSEAPRWSQIAERGSLWGLRFSVWCYRAFGRTATTLLAHAIVAYFFLTDRAGRRASLRYLRGVWGPPAGRAPLGRTPGPWLSFLHYRSFALAIVDRVAIWFGHGTGFEYEAHGVDRFDELAAEGRGAILVGAHLGSFDALRLLAVRARMVVNVLMFTDNAPRINAILGELSPETETRVIRVSPHSVQAVFELRRCLERGELVAILADRVEPTDRGRVSRVGFLGGEVELPQAPVLLAHLFGCPLFLMVGLRRGPGRYEVFAERLAERVRLPRRERDVGVAALLSTYAARLEHYCVRNPLQWFNFFDYWGEAPEAAKGRR
jgi:predicted LPLAT superfamily acyltransferase